jgi:hypothetical protein
MGAQAGEQLHRLQKVGLALAVGADHQQAGSRELKTQLRDVAELAQRQALQADGSGAISR